MKIFAISDPHLSFSNPKPMDIFGDNWSNHAERMKQAWQDTVGEDDLVLVPGDISWAMHIQDAMLDISFIAQLPGTKVILRGNHDYWWNSIGKVRALLPEKFYAIQNDSIRFGDVVIGGTRGWTCPNSAWFSEEEDRKIYEREVLRLSMSLTSMKAQENDICLAMLHYPPFNEKREESGFSSTMVEHHIQHVVYGHLHGNSCLSAFEGERDDVEYHLTSCDFLDFTPVLLLET